MIHNPFPGPQPYRTADRARFYGREEMSYHLARSILANRCVTVYGPSGAGKSSLVQASVIPALVESHEIDVVRIDAWPTDVDPTRWLADAMYNDLDLGPSPPGLAAEEAVFAAAQRVARRSPNLVVIYLDQIEQLLHASGSAEPVEAFFACLGQVVDLPLRNVRVMLSLREDYLGRFRDRLRAYRRILAHGFRVGPLSVAEIAAAVCQAAAAGDPPQAWDLEQMLTLMLDVRVPGQAATEEAEAQAAYAQIVCRVLFQQRADGDGSSSEIEAGPVLRSYLETTVDALGELRSSAQRLLEDHLISADGNRTLRTEKELLRLIPEDELWPILQALEGAAILRAEEHQGSRYFELGHDWLARKVFEQRQAREREEEQRRHDEEQQRELLRQRQEGEAKLAKERARRRRLAAVTIVSLLIAAGAVALGGWAWQQKREADEARQAAEEQRQIAVQREMEANRAQKEAEAQRKLAEELKQKADAEKARAEAKAEEAQRARDEARHSEQSARTAETQARTAETQARTAETQARTAETKAREEEQKASQAAEEERRSKEALEKLIERAAGNIKDTLK